MTAGAPSRETSTCKNPSRIENNSKSNRVEKKFRALECREKVAAGLAHDFNNILAAVIGYTRCALLRVHEEGAIAASLKNTLTAAYRGRELVQRLLTLDEGDQSHRQKVSVRKVAEDTLVVVGGLTSSHVDVCCRCDTERDQVYVDELQLHQIVLNLCTNACYALRAQGGMLEVVISRETLNDHNDLPPGDYVLLSVIDNGPGIEETVLEHIFDPFFTTKPKGEGTGIGLPMALSMVTKMNGALSAQSIPGKGSRFDLYLPAAA